MDSNAEKLKGTGDEIAGKIKRGVGDLADDPQMEADGAAQEAKGQGRREAAQASERVRGAGEQVVGGIKKAAGGLVDDHQLEAEGEAERLKGKAREQTNR
ncbi:MAG: CsbD family protein [Roseiflexaceae bacterium]|nr:CsbD family protein [Roseiflexaceae bacterium]